MAFAFLFLAIRQSYTDIRYRLIRNRDSALLLVIAIAFSKFTVIYSLTVLGIMLVLSLIVRESIGAGDIKLLAVLSGCASSPPYLLNFFTYVILLAGLFSVAAAIQRKSVHFSLPLAPFIWAAYFLTYWSMRAL